MIIEKNNPLFEILNKLGFLIKAYITKIKQPPVSLKKLISSVDRPALAKFVVNKPIVDQNNPAITINK